jgi:acetyl-CoA C-acetyltransferase
MTHAVCSMVRALRKNPQRLGLLYGQCGYFNKHHALVVSGRPGAGPLEPDYSVQYLAESARAHIPDVVDNYCGPATVETYTVTYDPKGRPKEGIVIGRTPEGKRLLAQVRHDDADTMTLLTNLERNAIGTNGFARVDQFGKPVWELESSMRLRLSAPLRFCTVRREGHLTIVTINRPEAMNALHPQANAELADVFDAFAADPDQWIAILTGTGERAFCAGNDLRVTSELQSRGISVEMPITGFAGITSRYDLNKPVIAAVNGVAMGGGFESALACDLIIACENAIFALPEPRVGLAAVAGGLQRLPREIGLKQAMGVILTGRRVSAQEGLALGFVYEVTTSAELMATACKVAAEIMELSPMSIRASKEAMHRGLESAALREAMELQMRNPAMRALYRSADLKEGPAAFSERRKPLWKGR